MNFLLFVVHAILLITVELLPEVDGLAFRNKRNMITQRRWTCAKDVKTGLVNIPWTVDCSEPDGCEKAKAAVDKAAEMLSKNTCIRLQYTSNHPNDPTDYIAVDTESQGDRCYTNIGRKYAGGKHDLFLGPECQTEGVAIHELMHALGFNHEHNRLDRDDYITINRENVDLSDNNFNIVFGKEEHGKTLGLPYDYNSIMHYARGTWSNGGGDTITTNDQSKQDVIGQRSEPTQLDYDKINKLYDCFKQPPVNAEAPKKSSEDCEKSQLDCLDGKESFENCKDKRMSCEKDVLYAKRCWDRFSEL